MKKNQKGITLIALVITIIILLILAAISISTLTGENGLFSKVKEAKEKSEDATKEENEVLLSMDEYVDYAMLDKEYPILDGEVGVKDIRFPYGHVKRYGAVGDGITNDTLALQYAISRNKNERVIFGYNETYNVTSGFMIDKKLEIVGNNSKILISSMSRENKDFYYNKENENENNGHGLFFYQFFMPKYYSGTSENWTFTNLTIDWEVQEEFTGEDSDTVTTYFLFRTYDVNEINFDNVNFEVNGNEKNSIQILTFTGQSNKVRVDNCKFVSKCHGFYGSCIWVQAHKKNGYKDVKITNCNFYQESRDEVISIWGFYSKDVLVENCNIERHCVPCYNKLKTGYTNNDIVLTFNATKSSTTDQELLNYLSNETYHKAVYRNCNIKVTAESGYEPISILQQLTCHGAKNEVIFENCKIDAIAKSTIISGENTNLITDIEDNREFDEKCKIFFRNCTCNFNCPSIAVTKSTNFEFRNCEITKKDCLVNVEWVFGDLITCWNGYFYDNKITLTNSTTLFKNIHDDYKNKIVFENNDVICYNSENQMIDIEKYIKKKSNIQDKTKRHELNASAEYIFNENTMNGKALN